MKSTRSLAVILALVVPFGLCAEPKVLRIALSENKPPYTIASPLGGIEYDLVNQIVQGMGMTAEISFLPNARAQAMLSLGEIDAADQQRGRRPLPALHRL